MHRGDPQSTVHDFRSIQDLDGTPCKQRRLRRPTRSAGFTLVEIGVAMAIFAVALSVLLQTIFAGHALRRLAREDWLATSVGQNVIEEMRNTPFRELVASFDADPFNDPAGPGTAHGNAFAVPGLDPTIGDADGLVGEVLLPVTNLGSDVAPNWAVREDSVDALLGLPRDLNGDAIVDALDHSDDYAVLPVLVWLRWRGRYGAREVRLFSSITQMRP